MDRLADGGATPERIMASFKAELDELARSLDESTTMDEIFDRARSANSTPVRPSTTTRTRTPDYTPPRRSTPRRTTGSLETPQREPAPISTPAEPVPIETPVYKIFSPDPVDSGTRRRAADDKKDESYESSPIREKSEPIKVPSDPLLDQESVQSVLRSMRETLERQDSRIRQLERENDELKLELRQQAGGRQRHMSHRLGVPQTELLHRSSVLDAPSRSRFSPGTRLVAELAKSMDVGIGNHAELSFILDEYWERLPKVRSHRGWG